MTNAYLSITNNSFLLTQLKGALSGLIRFLETESPLKMKKIAFYFTLIALFVLGYLHFVLIFWSCKKIGLIKTVNFISKFMTSQAGKQTIAIHILSDTSRGKGNQTMKFSQLIVNTLFFYKNHKFCLRLAVLNFFSFLRLKCS